MKWIRFAIPCNWLISCGRKQVRLANLMRLFVTVTKEILHLWTVEQDHKNSPYRFVRDTDRKEDTLVNDGFGPDFLRDRDDLVSLSSK